MTQDIKQPSPTATQTAAFSFQLSPELPAVAGGARDVASKALLSDGPLSGKGLEDAEWFNPSSQEPGGFSEAQTRTPPPASSLERGHGAELALPNEPARSLTATQPADPLAQTAASTSTLDWTEQATLTETPSSGHHLEALLSERTSDRHSPTASLEPEASEEDRRLPVAKPISFPPRGSERGSGPEQPGSTESDQLAEVAAAPPDVLDEPVTDLFGDGQSNGSAAAAASVAAGLDSDAARDKSPPVVAKEATAAFEQPAVTARKLPVSPAASLPSEPQRAARDMTSTLKVIGYALAAMVLSYLGMSAVVLWLTEPNDQSQALSTTVDAPLAAATPDQTQTAPPGSSRDSSSSDTHARAQSSKASAELKVVITETDLPAGLALDKDKGILKIATPDAHTIYVDGEFAGRGPIRIVPLPPGQHSVKTRLEGDEQEFSAVVKAGRMTRISLGAATD